MIRIPSFHTILSFFLGLLLLSCVLAVPALAQERRVYSGDTASLLNVDGRSIINIDRQNSRLGVGTATPAAKLDVILMGSESALLGNMRFVQAGNANYIQSGLTRTQGSWTTLHFSPYSTNQNILFTLSQNGNVGISSTSPQNKLDVVAAGTVNVARFFAGGAPSIALQTGSSGVGEGYLKWLESDAEEAGAIGVRMHNTAENYMTFRIQEEERMRISGSGLVGIGRTPTTHRLEVNGDAGKTSGGTAWVSLSDGRLKNVMGEIDSALSLISQLHPVTYDWNEQRKEVFGAGDEGKKFGFIAQELREVIPEFVSEDGEGYLWYNPSGIEAILTAAIQEQQTQINEMKAENAALKALVCLDHPSAQVCSR